MGERYSATATTAQEPALAALRARDEQAFCELVRRYSASMTRVALAFVGRRALAEEVVQEAWLNVLRGIDRFEGRSTLRTWIFAVLGNCARRRAEQEGRLVLLSALAAEEASGDDPGVPPEQFFDQHHPRWAGMWATVVRPFQAPEQGVLAAELRTEIVEAIERLPRMQGAVITLRDIEGWSAADVCECLGIEDGNQRVLLHRARTGVRAGLERYLGEA